MREERRVDVKRRSMRIIRSFLLLSLRRDCVVVSVPGSVIGFGTVTFVISVPLMITGPILYISLYTGGRCVSLWCFCGAVGLKWSKLQITITSSTSLL